MSIYVQIKPTKLNLKFIKKNIPNVEIMYPIPNRINATAMCSTLIFSYNKKILIVVWTIK